MRYLVFGGFCAGETDGGWSDFAGRFKTLAEARDAWKQGWEWAQIVDLRRSEVVLERRAHLHTDWYAPTDEDALLKAYRERPLRFAVVGSVMG